MQNQKHETLLENLTDISEPQLLKKPAPPVWQIKVPKTHASEYLVCVLQRGGCSLSLHGYPPWRD